MKITDGKLTEKQIDQLIEFYEYLCGPEACNFREEEGRTVWTCYSDLRFTNKWIREHQTTSLDILLDTSVLWHHRCDCEVVLNWPFEFEDEEEEDE